MCFFLGIPAVYTYLHCKKRTNVRCMFGQKITEEITRNNLAKLYEQQVFFCGRMIMDII